MRMSRRIAAGAAVVGAMLALTACDPTDSGSQPWNDAPVDKSVGSAGVQAGPAVVVNMPDGFNNMAYKCVKNPDGTFTMFVTTYHGQSAYGSVTVVQNAALCGSK